METVKNYVEEVISNSSNKVRTTIYFPKDMLKVMKIYCAEHSISLTQLLLNHCRELTTKKLDN